MKKDGSLCPIPGRPGSDCWATTPRGVTLAGAPKPTTLAPGTPDLPLATGADVTILLLLEDREWRRRVAANSGFNCRVILSPGGKVAEGNSTQMNLKRVLHIPGRVRHGYFPLQDRWERVE
jgi:hypothetical protein